MLRKSSVNQPFMMGKILKFVTSRHEQNAFPRLTHYIKLLNPKIMFVEGTLLTGGLNE